MSELTELGLKNPVTSEPVPASAASVAYTRAAAPAQDRSVSAAPAAATARPVETLVDRTPEGFAVFLDRLMEVLE